MSYLSRVFRGLLAFGAAALLTLAAFAADATRAFDVPAGDAAATLRAFAQQAQREIVFPPMNGVRTNAVKGDFTVKVALDRLIAGTELVAFEDPKSGAIVVNRRLAEEKNVASRLADAQAADGTRARIQNGTVQMEEFEVTGSRIRTLTSEQDIQPVRTITRREIERYGVSSLGELFRYIPQVTSYSAGQQVTTAGLVNQSVPSDASVAIGSTRVTAALRGAPAGGTLLLINGRRAPKNGQQNGADGYDLSGVPLAAVERVEVLLDGASAIYGSDAVGGVINVILKKNYRGTLIQLGYENTFETDVAVRKASVSHGFAAGRLSGMLTVSGEEANAMKWVDRSFLATLDRRPWGGKDNRSTINIGGTGRVSVASGNLPGLATGAVAIPAGSSGANVTAQDYADAGPVAAIADNGEYYLSQSPYRRKSALMNLDYEFSPQLTVFTEARWGESTDWSWSTPLIATNTTIPANAPGNPFGVAVRLNKYFVDLPLPQRVARAVNQSELIGARGLLAHDWRYETTVSRTGSRTELDGTGNTFFDSAKLAAAFASANPPRLLYDSTRPNTANPPGTLEALTTPSRAQERDLRWVYDVKADGPVWTLPAGELRIALGAEYDEDYVDFPLLSGAAAGVARNRYSSGYFAEARVPLVSSRQQWPLVDRLELSASIRRDQYSDFNASTNPRYGALYRPVKWLMLRGSYGEGYKVPTLNQLYQPGGTISGTFPGQFDRLRGNEPVLGLIEAVYGGNPNLQPERSKNTTAGVVLEVPVVKGLSFSYDYWDTDYIDRVGTISLTDATVLFPQTITRGPNLPTDPPGWAGPITRVDIRAVNVATNRITGFDVGAKYDRATSWGEFAASVVASKTTRNISRALPGAAPDATVTTDSLPLQVSGSFFVQRGPVDIGVMFAFRDRYQGTNSVNAPFTPSTIRWDWQGSYDFGRSAWLQRRPNSWSKTFLSDLKISVTVFNVFNREPPFGPGGMPDMTIIDARLRRFALNLSKRF